MAEKIVVTSGKGGVGKTSAVAGLGAALAAKGLRVCVLDADVGLNNLDVTLGTESRIVYDLADVVQNRCRPRQALVGIGECPGLWILPSIKGDGGAQITGEAIRAVALALDPTLDYLLIDCPAGIEDGFRRAAQAADKAIVVTTPHLPAVRDAGKTLACLRAYEYAAVGLVVNRVRGDLVLRGECLSPAQIGDLLACPVIGVIPEDDEVSAGAADGRILRDGTDAARAFAMLASFVTGESKELFDAERKYRGVFGRMRRGLRRIV